MPGDVYCEELAGSTASHPPTNGTVGQNQGNTMSINIETFPILPLQNPEPGSSYEDGRSSQTQLSCLE